MRKHTLNPPTNGVSQLMRYGRVPTVAALLNDSEFLTLLRGLPHAEERLEFLHKCRTETELGLQLKLWETIKRVVQPSWEPPGGWRVAPRVWQLRECQGCGQRKRVYEGLCRDCRQLKYPGETERFCSNCKCPTRTLKKGRCRACASYFYRHDSERTVDPEQRAKETSARRSASVRGRTVSSVARAKLSARAQKRWTDPEERAAQSRRKLGLKQTPEHVEKRVAQVRGRKQPPEVVAKRMAARKPFKLSPEARAAISTALRGRPGRKHTQETRNKMAAAARARWAKQKKTTRP